MNTPSVIDLPVPKIALKLPARDAEALMEWLDRSTAFRTRILDSSSGLRTLEKKRASVSAEIQKLEDRAEEASAAEQIPALQVQLKGIERKIEELGSAEFIDPVKMLLAELTPLMRKAVGPVIDREAAKIAEVLRPYFRSHHRAIAAVRASDWFGFLSATFLNEWRNYNTLDAAIRCVEALLKNELPFPYSPTPTQQDAYADANSDYLKTSGRSL